MIPLPRTRSPRPDRVGFTLIELLVVIAIIGVLVALLLPQTPAGHASLRPRARRDRGPTRVALSVGAPASPVRAIVHAG